MKLALTIIDEFFPSPQEARDFALEHDFTQAPEFDGHAYQGFAPIKDVAFLAYVENLLVSALSWNGVMIKMAAFVSAQHGFKTPQWIHSDDSCAMFAGVIHLHNMPGRGTKFWTHEAHGAALEKNLLPVDIDLLHQQGKTGEGFKEADYADSRYNRLVFYPTKHFHSRWPEEGVGDNAADSRLTMVLFFDVR